jgi:hypothetical protein
MRRCDSYYSVMPLGASTPCVSQLGRVHAIVNHVRTCETGTRSARRHGLIHRQLKRFSEWEVDWANTPQTRASTIRGWDKLPVRAR